MNANQFKVGERIRARPFGPTCGAIRLIAHTTPLWYLVWFDGHAGRHLMRERDLEHVRTAPGVRSGVTPASLRGKSAGEVWSGG